MSVREEILKHNVDVMRDADVGGLDAVKAAKTAVPGTPDSVLSEAFWMLEELRGSVVERCREDDRRRDHPQRPDKEWRRQMTAVMDFSTPVQTVREMIAAGARFTVRRRDDALGMSFTYRVADGGDQMHCRQILTAVKSRPAPFYQAFLFAVQDAVAANDRGAA